MKIRPNLGFNLAPKLSQLDSSTTQVSKSSNALSSGSARDARASACHGEYKPDFQLRLFQVFKSQKLRIRHALWSCSLWRVGLLAMASRVARCGELRHVTREARGFGSRGER
ncbi:hypothetical protein MTR_2g445220 [Medicago truncatula]|uniref:Uncharacterized protein n=1 Tax=Medicago truncatula TaxID=3880 RepID=A0A072VHR5_MEDTR|nr:hypothetical protein MTR_2g445220 [Medicago truncatula]